MKRPHLDLVLEKLSQMGPVTVLDIGAYIGKLTGFFIEANPECYVHAIEPDPANFAILSDRFHPSRVTSHQLAIGPVSSAMPFYTANRKKELGSSQSNSLSRTRLKQKKREGKIKRIETIQTACLTISDFMKQIGCSAIGLAKINVEGAEEYILSNQTFLDATNMIYVSMHDGRQHQLEQNGFKCLAKTQKGEHSWEVWSK